MIQAPRRGKEIGRVAELLAQPGGSDIGVFDVRRRIASGRDQRIAKHNQRRELPLMSIAIGRKLLQHVQRASCEIHGLPRGEELGRILRGESEIVGGARERPGRFEQQRQLARQVGVVDSPISFERPAQVAGDLRPARRPK